MTGKKAPGCPHPKAAGEGKLPGEFHGLCANCVTAVADRLRAQGIHVAFTQHGASSRPVTGRLAAWWHGRWTSTGKAARSGAQHLQRLAAQAPERARNAGRKLAGQVIMIQESAGLDQGPAHLLQRDPIRLMHRSALSVISSPALRASDAAWREGYQETAMARIPGLARRRIVAQPDQELEAG
jgi:hypothetical protein